MESFDTPEIFFEIQRRGRVHADEMVRVFNCGLGMVVALDADVADAAITDRESEWCRGDGRRLRANRARGRCVLS